jgi:integrase
MARRPNPVPVYKKHPTKNEARCYVGGRWVSLGPWNSERSRAAYERICAAVRKARNEAAAGKGGADPARAGRERLKVAGLVANFLTHAQKHYRRPDGTPTSEVKEYLAVLMPLAEGDAGGLFVGQFGPLDLQLFRDTLVGRGWCRTRVNKQIGRVKRVFRWGVSRQLVPLDVHSALQTVDGLRKGRSDARERESVRPVPAADVEAAAGRLNRHQRAMVRLQLLTGMRPGEVCRLALGLIDRSADVWVWDVDGHKMEHAGRSRLVFFGPRARRVIEEFAAGGLRPAGEGEPLFSPRRAREERFAAMRAARKSKPTPKQLSPQRLVKDPKRQPAGRYSPGSYSHAIEKAARGAGVPIFGANRLRHTFATECRRTHGLEAAQVLLGHAKMSTSEVYAAKAVDLARRVAGEIG